jgi:UDP-N-acetylmuramate--alanine ligase
MIQLKDIHSVYFVGAGGIGMSALVRFFLQRGVAVSGYDKTATDLTNALLEEGAKITFNDDVSTLDKQASVVIYTPAIPKELAILNWYIQNGYQVIKRSDMLHIISKAMQALCVAGTHGKTTTSTILAHILKHSDIGCNAFLGGISSNYNTNYWGSTNDVAVIEADEYDRSFLKLQPYISIVTAMDADHLDIYGTEEEMQNTYLQYINSTTDSLVYKLGLPRRKEFAAPKMFSYSLQNDAADFYASNIAMKQGTYTYEFCFKGEVLAPIKLNVGGMHNVENAIAAAAVAYLFGIDSLKIAAALADYKGVVRRFQYWINTPQLVYIDDYAHHPEELTALIKSAKALFAGKKITIAFQPHLFTRTRDFLNGFAQSLSMADEVILLDIYPARELPIDGITSQLLLDKITCENKHILTKDGLLEYAAAATPQVFITAGAGDIDKLVPSVFSSLKQKIK